MNQEGFVGTHRSAIETPPLPYDLFPSCLLPYVQEWINQPRPKGVRQRKMGVCFANAARLSNEKQGLTYVEGYTLDCCWIHHAWCVDDEGRVVDPTWEHQEGRRYIGVPFTDYWLSRAMVENGMWGATLHLADPIHLDLRPGDIATVSVQGEKNLASHYN